MPGLIPCPKSIWLAVAPVDMRLGADGLSLQGMPPAHPRRRQYSHSASFLIPLQRQ